MNAYSATATLQSVILYCPHLDRDIRNLLKQVPNPRILTGYPTIPGEVGCLEMHLAAIRTAQKEKWEAIFVMEDDCQFTEAFNWWQWISDCQWARAHGYDALIGGSVKTDGRVRYASKGESHHLVAVEQFCSAHCIVYFESAYQRILDGAKQPYDMSLKHCGVKTVLTLPFVAIQRAGLSGIGRPLEAGESQTYGGLQHVNYEGLYKMHEGHLLRTLQ